MGFMKPKPGLDLDTDGQSSETVLDEVQDLLGALALTADPGQAGIGTAVSFGDVLVRFRLRRARVRGDRAGPAEDEHEETEFVRNFDTGWRFLSLAGDC
jgi:hypothetical protein